VGGRAAALVNMAFGVYFAAGSGASECAWYLTNFAISIFCGIFLLWAAMKAYRRVVEHYQLVLLRSGEYGNPPSWQPWLAQLVVWGFISAAEKVITAVVIILPLHGMLDGFALWMEQPFVPYPNVELLLVMVLAPVLLNVCFFWVVDNLVMRKRAKGRADEDGSGSLGGDEDRPLLNDECCCMGMGRGGSRKGSRLEQV